MHLDLLQQRAQLRQLEVGILLLFHSLPFTLSHVHSSESSHCRSYAEEKRV